MSAEAAAYPKLLKIYKELNRHNGIIFEAERERNELELQSRIDRKNEEIDLLKVGLSGIVKRYGFQTVHDFYKVFAAAKKVYDDYQDKAEKWEERHSEKVRRREESIHRRLQNFQRKNAIRQLGQINKF